MVLVYHSISFVYLIVLAPNATHLISPFKLKEMALQRSTKSSLLISKQPTHQSSNMDEIQAFEEDSIVS